jgi:Pyruvate/2-oxoacid:ferredoxin oxidoreductase delta subunit
MGENELERRKTPLKKIRLWKDSTRAFYIEARRTPGFSLFDFLHGYVYLRWPYLYIGIGTGEHRFSKWIRPLVNIIGKLFISANGDQREKPTVAETYHGKVVPLEAAKQLVMVQEPIAIDNLEQIIPFKIARDLILEHPDHIAVVDCPCRLCRSEPCLPLDVCLIIGEPFASLVIEHHPARSRWITSEEAQEILESEHKRGHVHHAYFKDAMLGRFYAICNCCSCCCGAMQAVRNGSPMIISSGYVCKLDQELCIDCDICVDYCQFGALSTQEGSLTIDDQICMGCGVCVSVCPVDALSLRRDPEKPAPLEIHQLIQEATTQG